MKFFYVKNIYFWITCFALTFTVLFFFSGKPLYAHNPGQSYTYLKIYDDKLTGRFEITLSDLNKALNHAAPRDLIEQATLKDRLKEVHDYYREHVTFSDSAGLLPIRFLEIDTMKAGKSIYVLLNFAIVESRSLPDTLDIDYSVMFDVDPSHQSMVLIEQNWKANIYNNESHPSLFFSVKERHQVLKINEYSIFNGFLGVVKLGVKHIWIGIDHILFLVALILPSAMFRRENNWQPVPAFRPAFFYVVKIVTLFTIAHSITLSLAALNIILLPSKLVESVIALSIGIAALDILFPIFHRKIGWLVFIFGLFHGFGFASVLTHLGVLGEYMALSLFGFNLGIEFGQLVIICLIFPVLFIIRQYAFFPKIIMRYGAVALIFMAAIWFVERAILETPFTRIIRVTYSKFIS